MSSRWRRTGVRAGIFGVALAMVLPASMALGAHGGQFSIDYKAADPTAYPTAFPITQACPPGGQAAEPLPGAQHGTGLESLTPSDMVLGQIVAFEFEVTVGNAAPADSSIEIVNLWGTTTTPAGDFGYDENFLVYCAFVDTADPAANDPEGDASATVSSALVAADIQGTFEVVGLDPGDVVVVEAWLVLDKRMPPGTSGNVQSRIDSARTLTPDVDTISTGAQTIPILRVQDFLGAILIQKLINADSDQNATFDFSGDITATLGHGGLSAPLVVEDGVYTTTETVPAGWLGPEIVCDDDDSTGSGATATFNVSNETIICIFTNSETPPPPADTTTTTTTTTVSTTTTTAPPATTTTSPVTTEETLPLTGRGSAGIGSVGLALLALGSLLLAIRRERRERREG